MTRWRLFGAAAAAVVAAGAVMLGARGLASSPTAATPEATGPRAFHVEFGGFAGHPSYPYDLLDKTGTVEAFVRAAPEDLGPFPTLTNVPGRPDQLHLSVMGGACDGGSAIVFEHVDGVYDLSIETRRPAVDCADIGLVRGFVIDLSQPVDATFVGLVNSVSP